MIDALLWVLSYNGYDEKIMQIYKYLKENADKSQVPYPDWLSDDADAPDRILWSVLVMLDGDYGTSPRYGWIDRPKSAIERMARFAADVKGGNTND